MTKPVETPLPGLLITSLSETAVKAMFARNVDIVILRQPYPVAFEIASHILYEARPDIIQQGYTLAATATPTTGSTFIADLSNERLWKDCSKDVTAAREFVATWFARVKEVATAANPHATKMVYGTRSGYATPKGDERPRAGFHTDSNNLITADEPLPWRVAITMIGGGTQIIEKRALRALCDERNPRIEMARKIAANDFPYPTDGKRDDDITRLKRNARMSDVLFEGQKIVQAKCGDMVFIAQKRPEHLWHATPQYNEKPRLAFVLDMV